MSLEAELLELLKRQNENSDMRFKNLEQLGADSNGMLQKLVDIHQEARDEEKADRAEKLALEKARIEGRSKVVSMVFTPAGFAAIGTLLTTVGAFIAGIFGWHKAPPP